MADQTQVNQESIKDRIKAEFIRCGQDPAYFIKKYVMIQHPMRGRIPFDLFVFQEKVLNLFDPHQYLIINKSRQLGISTLVGAYALWLMMYHTDKNILIVATKQDTAKNMVTKISFAYENLPSWMKKLIPTEFDNKLSMRFTNGSQIKAVSAATDAGRSEAASLLVLDEAAFIDNIETIFTAAQQTLATGGKCIAISTPNGTGNWFHKEFTKGETGEGKFVSVRLPWTIHPERNEHWRKEQDQILGARQAAQECDCDFTTSGATVIEPEIIKWYEQQIIPPVEKRYIDQNLWIWKYPEPHKIYATIVDTARGDGNDFSTIQVMDVETCEQVAEYKGQLDTRDFGNLAVTVATEYNDSLLVIENTNVGWDVVQTAISRQYRNLYYSPRTEAAMTNIEVYLNRYDKGDGMVPGFSNSTRTRPLVVSKYTSYMHEKSCTIKSKRLIDETKTFIWKNGKAQALDTYNDDLIMPWAIGLFLRDTTLRYRQTAIDLSRTALDNIQSSNLILKEKQYTRYDRGDGWNMQDPYGNPVDLKWLL